MKQDLDNFEQSALIGLWRMGTEDYLISIILNCTDFVVRKTIYDYKRKLDIDLKRQKPTILKK